MMKIYADNAATTKRGLMKGPRGKREASVYDGALRKPVEPVTPSDRREAKEGLEAASHRRSVHRRAAQRDHLHLRRQRGRQPGNPLARCSARKREKAHHFDQI